MCTVGHVAIRRWGVFHSSPFRSSPPPRACCWACGPSPHGGSPISIISTEEQIDKFKKIVSEEEIAQLKEIFAEFFDKDGDGIITKEEFRTRIVDMALIMIQRGKMCMMGCARMHDALDEAEADVRNDTIDFATFLGIMCRKLTSPVLPIQPGMTSPATTDVDM